MKKNNTKSSVNWYELVAVVATILFVSSVINNVHDFTTNQIQNAPASYALIIALLCIVYGSFKNNKISSISSGVLMALITAVSIWGFGLHSWLR